jgi:hypothetical protein
MDAPSPATSHTYSDGHPLDAVHYREYKLILRPTQFTSARSFGDFIRLVRHAAEELDVALFREERPEPQIREVLFFDTADSRLYNSKFILRQRTIYRSGWPVDEHEVVLKFRHSDQEVAAAVDVRPTGGLAHLIKFKEELLPLREGLGGIRSLFSHNCTLDDAPALRDRPFQEVAAVFPALQSLAVPPDALVSASVASPPRRCWPTSARCTSGRAPSQGQRRDLARPGPADAAGRGSRSSAEFEAVRGATPQGQEAVGGFFHTAAARGATGCSLTRPRPRAVHMVFGARCGDES